MLESMKELVNTGNKMIYVFIMICLLIAWAIQTSLMNKLRADKKVGREYPNLAIASYTFYTLFLVYVLYRDAYPHLYDFLKVPSFDTPLF